MSYSSIYLLTYLNFIFYVLTYMWIELKIFSHFISLIIFIFCIFRFNRVGHIQVFCFKKFLLKLCSWHSLKLLAGNLFINSLYILLKIFHAFSIYNSISFNVYIWIFLWAIIKINCTYILIYFFFSSELLYRFLFIFFFIIHLLLL